MNTRMTRTTVSLLIVTLTISPMLSFAGDTGLLAGTSGVTGISTLHTYAPAEGTFSQDELDEMLGPIALYPDPLLAQLLPSATFIDQLDEAQKLLKGKADDDVIAKQDWDISVKAVAHYPEVLKSMTQKHDWTIALGQAYVTQQSDVEEAIQRLRAEAKAAGSLVSSDKMAVDTKTESGKQVIVVEPAQAEVIYVPSYSPEVVYVQQGPSTGTVVAASVIAFSAGLALGAWLNRGWHWYGGGPYYHGWVGAGWIGRSATHVNINVNRNVYVNNTYRNVNVNRSITSRNITTYRNDLTRTASLHHEQKVNANNLRRDNNNAGAAGANRARTNNAQATRAGTAKQNQAQTLKGAGNAAGAKTGTSAGTGPKAGATGPKAGGAGPKASGAGAKAGGRRR